MRMSLQQPFMNCRRWFNSWRSILCFGFFSAMTIVSWNNSCLTSSLATDPQNNLPQGLQRPTLLTLASFAAQSLWNRDPLGCRSSRPEVRGIAEKDHEFYSSLWKLHCKNDFHHQHKVSALSKIKVNDLGVKILLKRYNTNGTEKINKISDGKN